MAKIAQSAPVWLRISDEDREKFGGPEWVVFDAAAMFHMPSSELEALEQAMPVPLAIIIANMMTKDALYALFTRCLVFAARRQAGVLGRDGQPERWEDFNPTTLQVVRRGTNPNGSVPPPAKMAEPAPDAARRPGKGPRQSAASKAGSKAAPSRKSSTTSPPP
jgi:hypothetical protein